MNIILLQTLQLFGNNEAKLNSAQSEHVRSILKLSLGDHLRVGLINGNMGLASITSLGTNICIRIEHLNTLPPPILPLTVVLALPRPQMIKRILQTIACMGVQHLCLIQTSKVEKSFWQSPAATDTAITQQLITGLEQGIATQLPTVEKYLRFRPFAEDSLQLLSENKQRYIAHPGTHAGCPQLANDVPAVMAIGPEGGFTDKEVEWFKRCNFTPVQMGQRILKVETAVTALIAKLYR